MDIPRNLSTRDAIRIARELGFAVLKPNRTGELLFISPTGDRDRMNCRRKDASLKIVSLLRQAAKGIVSA